MKYLLAGFMVLSMSLTMAAQGDWPTLDKSPYDVEYYPQEVAWRNYLDDSKRNLAPKIKLAYSRPSKSGREIFGALIPYGTEWRLGANEATTLSFYQPVAVGSTTLMGGTYTLSALVSQDTWTINLSTESGIWGSANRDKSKTVASVDCPVEMVEEKREDLAITFQEIDELHVNMIIEWDGRRVRLPISFNPVLFTDIDASPMDVAHFPRSSAFNNYAESEDDKAEPKLQVVYSRPQKKGRTVFGELVPYGSVWRLGANEATEIAVFQDVSINGVTIKRGRYALFAEVSQDKWQLIFSKDYPMWGEYKRDTDKDIASITIPVTTAEESLEALSIKFEEVSAEEAIMHIGWDMTRAAVPFKFMK